MSATSISFTALLVPIRPQRVLALARMAGRLGRRHPLACGAFACAGSLMGAMVVGGPARMALLVAALLAGGGVLTLARRGSTPAEEHSDWDCFEAEFRDYVDRLERAP